MCNVILYTTPLIHRILQYLQENLDALQLKLSADDIAELRKIAENATLGDRYGEGHMGLVLQDTPPLE